MSVDRRDDRVGELEQELVREDDPLAGLKDEATPEQFEATLNRLRQVRDRAKRRQLEADDWAIVTAVIQAEMKERMR
jgi:hypothetical protein